MQYGNVISCIGLSDIISAFKKTKFVTIDYMTAIYNYQNLLKIGVTTYCLAYLFWQWLLQRWEYSILNLVDADSISSFTVDNGNRNTSWRRLHGPWTKSLRFLYFVNIGICMQISSLWVAPKLFENHLNNNHQDYKSLLLLLLVAWS